MSELFELLEPRQMLAAAPYIGMVSSWQAAGFTYIEINGDPKKPDFVSINKAGDSVSVTIGSNAKDQQTTQYSHVAGIYSKFEGSIAGPDKLTITGVVTDPEDPIAVYLSGLNGKAPITVEANFNGPITVVGGKGALTVRDLTRPNATVPGIHSFKKETGTTPTKIVSSYPVTAINYSGGLMDVTAGSLSYGNLIVAFGGKLKLRAVGLTQVNLGGKTTVDILTSNPRQTTYVSVNSLQVIGKMNLGGLYDELTGATNIKLKLVGVENHH
jgi:hypothetical protein